MGNLTIFCKNIFGKLSPKYEKKLKKVLDNPTPETWDDAYSIIIDNKPITTLWQAVIKVNPEFPTKTNGIDLPPNEKWDEVPTKETLKQALQLIVKKRLELQMN